jgi:hypothetical protein
MSTNRIAAAAKNDAGWVVVPALTFMPGPWGVVEIHSMCNIGRYTASIMITSHQISMKES